MKKKKKKLSAIGDNEPMAHLAWHRWYVTNYCQYSIYLIPESKYSEIVKNESLN